MIMLELQIEAEVFLIPSLPMANMSRDWTRIELADLLAQYAP